jgi:hypothetical protein
MTQDFPPDAENRARALFGDLIERRWEKAYAEFGVSMRGHVDVDLIACGWIHVAEPAGSFQRMGVPSACQADDYTVVDVPLAFQAGDAIGRVVLDRDGKVSGLTMEYRRRRRLDPRRVRSFMLGNGNPEVAELLQARLANRRPYGIYTG